MNLLGTPISLALASQACDAALAAASIRVGMEDMEDI